MINLDSMVSMPFFKKTRFTGSCKNMNYIIQKVTEEEESFLEGIVWKGPYNSDTTPEEKKIRQRFPFSEEGIQLAVAWLNEQREQGDWERL